MEKKNTPRHAKLQFFFTHTHRAPIIDTPCPKKSLRLARFPQTEGLLPCIPSPHRRPQGKNQLYCAAIAISSSLSLSGPRANESVAAPPQRKKTLMYTFRVGATDIQPASFFLFFPFPSLLALFDPLFFFRATCGSVRVRACV